MKTLRIRNFALGLALAPVCLLTMTGLWATMILASLVDERGSER